MQPHKILTNTFINSYRSKKRRPDEVELDDSEDFYLFRRLGGLEAADAERTPETEVRFGFKYLGVNNLPVFCF
jgi:RNA polymerase sigma-70 factor (ECF subfamily)